MKISELMIGLRKLDLVLPEFQREYVWRLEQAKQLMVSLYREYPTGSLLVWKTDDPPRSRIATSRQKQLAQRLSFSTASSV